MSSEPHDEHERLAPVIPLFGARHGDDRVVDDGAIHAADGAAGGAVGRRAGRTGASAAAQNVDDAATTENVSLADVRSVLGHGTRPARGTRQGAEGMGQPDDASSDEAAPSRARHPAGSVPGRAGSRRVRPDPAAEWDTTWSDLPAPGDESAVGEAEVLAAVHKALVRKIGTHQLSESEARQVARDHDLGPAATDGLIDEFLRLGYLDDRALAEQLARSGMERKGQGRHAIAQALSRRGIPRDVAALVLAELPDDDAERALEFARQKARSLRRLPHETALRRLAGQLARRGYPSSVSLKAARQALDEPED